MTLIEQIKEEASVLQPQLQQQVLDFIVSLKIKQQKDIEADMDAIILENLLAWKALAK